LRMVVPPAVTRMLTMFCVGHKGRSLQHAHADACAQAFFASATKATVVDLG
jgi:hypothetical protein